MKPLTSIAIVLFSAALRAQDPCGAWWTVPIPDPVGATQIVVEDVEALGPDLAWAVGRYVVPSGTNFASKTVSWRWDGSAWTIIATPSPSAPTVDWSELSAVEILSPNDVWAAGTQNITGPDGFVGSHLLAMHWNGTQWSIVPAPMTAGGSGNFVDDIEAIAPNDIWFVGDWLTFPPSSVARKEALAMHWNGNGFSIVPAPFFDNQTIGGHGLTKVSALASNDVWAVGGGHDGDYVGFSYVVHWNGSQWQYVPGPTPSSSQRWYDVAALAPNDVWISGDYQDANGVHGLAAHWNGTVWTRPPDPPVGGTGLHVFSPDRIYVSGSGVARWNGQGWSVVETFPAVVGASVVALEPIADCSLWGVGRRIEGNVLRAFSARLDAVGTTNTFCTGMPNSVGSGASISSSGSTSISAANLVLSVAGVPPQSPGLFFYGDQQAQPVGFGNGVRCIGGSFQRLPVVFADGVGVARQIFPYTASAVAPSRAAGFQFWYRDSAAGGAAFNTSNAIEIVFGP